MFNPKFSITNKILKNVSTIETCREIINNAPLVPQWEAKFREDAIARTVYHGTHIEGNDLSFTEAELVLKGKQIPSRDRDVQEIINFRNVLRYIDEQYRDKGKEISDGTIRHIHKLTVDRLLPVTESGNYRRTQVVVRNSKTREITFRPPNAVEVPYLMSDFCTWLNNKKTEDISAILRSGITQYEIVRIHPFIDGNGRTARATATLILFKEGYDIKKFFSLEEYYDRNPHGYYTALQSVTSEEKDLTFWLEYFTEGLANELSRIKEKVLKLSVDAKLKERVGGQIALSERQIKLIEFIERNSRLQNKDFREVLPMVSDDTILRDLKDLMKKKIIKKQGVTKSAEYVMKE